MEIETTEEERRRLITEANTLIVGRPSFTGEGLTNEQIRERTKILLETIKLAFSETFNEEEDF